MREINSKENPLLKLVSSLKRKKDRDKTGLFVLEGLRGLEEAVKADIKINTIVVADDFNLVEISKFKQELVGIDIVKISRKLFNEIAATENPQGILFIAAQFIYKLQDILKKDHKFIVIADEIQDPGNLGTIIRTAAAAKADGLLLTKGSVDIYNQKVIRSSMGGIFKLPFVAVEDTAELLQELGNLDYKVVVADISAEQDYYEANLQGAIALVLGNENKGPSQDFMEMSKEFSREIVKIPMPGGVESLNVSVAAGILIYEILRQKNI